MLESLGLTALLWLLLFFCGWWIVRLALPVAWRPFEYVLAPLAGLCWIDGLSHTLSWLGLPGRQGVVLLMVLTAALSGLVLLCRGWPRRPNRVEAAVLVCALPALVLALFPLLAADRALPIGDTNGDPVSHALMTEYLLAHSMRGAAPLAEGSAVWQPVYGKLDLGIRLGFHFVQLALDLLSGRPAFATFSPLSAFGLFLAAQALYLLARQGLGMSPLVAGGSALLAAVNSYLLWFHYGGFGPQVLGAGLLLMALASWWTWLRAGETAALVWAAMMTAGLTGIYSEMLMLLGPVVGLSVAAQALSLKGREARRLGLGFLGGLGLVLLFNPVGSARAVRRYLLLLDAGRGLGAGSVDWMVDLRMVWGLLPFAQRLPEWTPAVVLAAATVLLIGVLFVAVLGLARTPARRLAGVFLAVHLALQAAFFLSGRTYAYFKGWGYGLPVYMALLAEGGYALYLRVGRWRELVVVGAAGLWLLTLAVSLVLALSMGSHWACTPGIAELKEAASLLPPGASVYIVNGGQHRVSVFWTAYFLRDHPLHLDAPLIYTTEPARPYGGEAYVLLHREASFDFAGYGLSGEAVWTGSEWALIRIE